MARGGESSGLCVIGREYCNKRVVELEVVRKVMVPNSDNTIIVGDSKKNIVFKIEDTTSTYGIHKKRVLRDGDGTPILTFRHKVMSLHSRWRVYKGGSEDKKDLIFTAKQSSIKGPNKELNVFLVTNKDEKVCDFKVGTSSDILVYLGNSHEQIIAEIHDCTAKVYPNVDQAFIISLIVILDGMNQRGRRNGDMAKLVLEGFILGAGFALA